MSEGEAGNTPLAQMTESPQISESLGGGSTTTQIGDVSAGRDIHIGASPAELIRLTEVFSNQIGVSTEALAKAEARAADLAAQLGFTVEAVVGFFRTVGEQGVPLEKVPAKLAEIAARHRGGPGDTKPSIAVLPFQNMSGDPTQEYFADGMVDEITTALSRVRWLHVVSRNSSFTYKGQAIDVRQIGRELGVAYVLEGSVRKSGNRVRISAQLIEVETGVNLWADRFDGSLEEVFDLQDNVAASVAGVIEPALQIAEVQRSSRRPTTDLAAYDLYLRAHAMMLSPARRIAEIEKIFDEVLERDPDFGPALALAAAFHMNCDIMGWWEDQDTNCRKGLERGRRALTVANDDPTILVNAAFALGYFGANLQAMIVLVDRALTLKSEFRARMACQRLPAPVGWPTRYRDRAYQNLIAA